MNIPVKKSELVVASNPYLKIIKKNFINDGGEESSFLITAHNKNRSIGTFILPITDDNKIIYLEEFRYGPEQFVINFPVGMLEDNLDEIENCKQELLQETGYYSEDFTFLGESIIENYFEGYIKYYIAHNCKKQISQSLDIGEEINIKFATIKEFEEIILQNKIYSSKSCYLFFLAQKKGFLNF